MRAKEYAKRFHEELSKRDAQLEDVVADTLTAMLEEAKASPRAQSGDISVKAGVFDELERKWKAFCEEVKDYKIDPNLFNEFFRIAVPDDYNAWQSYKRILNFDKNNKLGG